MFDKCCLSKNLLKSRLLFVIGFLRKRESGNTTLLDRRDAQGNIVALIDSSGAVVVRYAYDAWGNHAVLDGNGNDITDANHIGNLNPFRYRGYFYDTETELYYLQTRYYDPEIGRFITIDGIEYIDPETINGLNLYAYCGNNPVMFTDPNGTAKWWQWLLFGIGAALVVAAAVVLTVASGGTAAGLIGAVAVGAAKGALIGAAVGSAVGIAGGAIYSAVTGADMGQSILSGFLMGFGIGAIVGAVIGGVVGGVTYSPNPTGLSKSAIKEGVQTTLNDPNKMNHIMQPKHNLPNSAHKVGKIMQKTLIKGSYTPYKSVSSVIWKGYQVTYKIINNVIKISNMWFLL